MPVTVIDGPLALDLPDETPSTVESSEGRPDVHRYFVGTVVIATSVAPVSGQSAESAVESAAGDVLRDYRHRPGYARTSRPAPDVPGAAAAARLEFEWTSTDGEPMRSDVIVAATDTDVAVVHAAVLVSRGDVDWRTATRLVGSATLVPRPDSGPGSPAS